MLKKDETINFRISSDLKYKFYEKCKQLKVTPTAKLNEFIKKYVELDLKEQEERQRQSYLKHNRIL